MSVCIKDLIQNMNLVIGCTVGCTYCYARNNVKRWHMIDDFAHPEFFPDKIRLMDKPCPHNYLLTGMSDLAGWQDEWREQVFAKIAANPQHQFLFLKHYHITFEPLFDDPETVDLSGIGWIVVGTMTGPQSRNIRTEPAWALSLTDQAHANNIPVFWKEDLLPIMGESAMIQELPEAFHHVLEEQRVWNSRKSK